MVNILVECPELVASARLGIIESLRELEQRGVCSVIFVRTMDIRREHIVWADILVTVRGCEEATRRIVCAAKEMNRFIIYYLDDDLLHIPEESLACWYYIDPVHRKNISSIIQMSDVLWGVNDRIRERYSTLGNGRWMQNRLPVYSKTILQKKDKPIKILYAGSSDHQVLVREVLAPVILRLHKEYGNHVEFTFIGVDPELSSCVHYVSFIEPYEKYRSFVESAGFHIGLAPGRDDAFYACKYYNKFVEYTSIGAVGVYTNVPPYTDIVQDGKNGVLTENTEDAWYQAVKRLIDSPVLRVLCEEKAYKQLTEEFSPASVTDSLLQQCPELSSYHAPDCTVKQVPLWNGPVVFYWERAKLHWRAHGIVALPEILYKGVRRAAIELGKEVYSFVQKIFGRYME